jgi:hypothetical protein
MCLNGVLVPHCLPHPGTSGRGLGSGVSVECGGDVVRAALGTARLLKVISRVGEYWEGGRPFGLLSPGKSGVLRSFRKPGVASLAGVSAAQGGEARQGPRQGELPASLPASLIGSL